MIVFNLVCANDHCFEGWFASTADFDRQRHNHLLTCPACGNHVVEKALHAPYVNTGARKEEIEAPDVQRVQQYANLAEELLKVAEYVVQNTEDVGDAFPEEVRKIHYAETPARQIRGTASTEEVAELQEEGIEVVALPVPAYRLGKTH